MVMPGAVWERLCAALRGCCRPAHVGDGGCQTAAGHVGALILFFFSFVKEAKLSFLVVGLLLLLEESQPTKIRSCLNSGARSVSGCALNGGGGGGREGGGGVGCVCACSALRRGSAALSEGEALRICLSLGACLPYIPPAACMPNEMQMSSPPIWLELSQRSHFSKPSSQWIAKWSVSCKMCNPSSPSPERSQNVLIYIPANLVTARIPLLLQGEGNTLGAPERGSATRSGVKTTPGVEGCYCLLKRAKSNCRAPKK